MKITFRQGIVAYQSTGLIQSFLAKTGVYVSLQTTNADTIVAFAHGGSDYLLTEAADVTNAWGPIPVSTDTWLFWDIDLQTGVRTFGFTLIEPTEGTEFPVSPQQGQHFFNLDDTTMYLFDLGGWRPVVRVFAAKVNNSTFTALGSGFASKPFSGTQVGLFANVSAGHILFDEAQAPIRRSNGEFFTTDSDIFTASAPTTSIRIEASVLTATARENLAAYQVVYFSQFGKINAAEYDNLQDEAIGILLESLLINQTGTVLIQGTVTNPGWTWTTVGAPLWIDDTGALTETDPHVSPGPTFYPIGKPPVARVITPTTIIFDQGLGAKGDTGLPGTGGSVDPATDTELGTVRLSVAAVDEEDPVVVGDNDPRFGTFVLKAGDTMTGLLTLSGNPTAALHAATKQYVDAEILAAPFVELAGDTMTGFLTLNADPTNALHAATKQYVDAASGSPAGNNTNIQYNDSGSFGGDADFTWDATNNILSIGSVATPGIIRTPDGSASAGATLTIFAGDGVGTDQNGGDITITAGAATGVGTPGIITLTGGNGDTLEIGASIVATAASFVQLNTPVLDLPATDTYITILEHTSAPSTPTTGRIAVYANSGELHTKDDVGNVSRLIDATKFTLQFLLETGADNTYTLVQSARFEFSIDAAFFQTNTGTITANVRINSTSVTGLDALSLTSTPDSVTASGSNDVSVGNIVDVAFSSNSTATFVSLMLECTRA